MRIGWYFARATVGWFLGLTVVCCGLIAVWMTLLPEVSDVAPSPWALMGPLFWLAGMITWSRACSRGELTAAAAGGTGGAALAVPVVCAGVALQLLFAVPAGFMPRTAATAALVQTSVAGGLFLEQEGFGVVLRADGEVCVFDGGGLPPGWKSAPYNVSRYRRQAFFTHAPRWGAQDAFDPWWWRILYVVLVVGLPGVLMAARDGWVWSVGILPLALPLLL